jgi:LuxR family quorum sensing-dependent transcriptional regulator
MRKLTPSSGIGATTRTGSSRRGQKSKPDGGPRPDIFEEATSFGIREGLAVGIKVAGGDVATIALGTEERAVPVDDRVTLNFAALACASRLAQLGGNVAAVDPLLTDRQRECLSWAASGKTDWEISQILGLSHRTVQEHLSRCIAKLQATNRAHAVATAVLMNLISV